MAIDRKLLVSDEGKLKISAADGQLADKNCCCNFTCEINLICDSVSASKTKCGFSPFHNELCYEPYTDFGYSDSRNFTGCSAELFDCVTVSGSEADPATLYLTQTVSLSGASVADACAHSSGHETSCCDTNCDTSGDSEQVSYYDTDTCEVVFDDATGTGISCTDPCFGCVSSCPPCTDPPGGPPFLSHPVSGTATLSDEYTTDLLISNTEEDFADLEYPDTFAGSCSALRNLSDDETSYTISKFKYKWTFPARYSFFQIWWTERFTSEDGETINDTERTWNSRPDFSPTPGVSVKFTEDNPPVRYKETKMVWEIPHPSVDGDVSIVNIRFSTLASCTPGYNPDSICDRATMNCGGDFDDCRCANKYPPLP